MLVLTRREGEVICIGNDIRVTVLSLHRGKVRLGVDAPESVRIHRDEIQSLVDDAENLQLGHND